MLRVAAEGQGFGRIGSGFGCGCPFCNDRLKPRQGLT